MTVSRRKRSVFRRGEGEEKRFYLEEELKALEGVAHCGDDERRKFVRVASVYVGAGLDLDEEEGRASRWRIMRVRKGSVRLRKQIATTTMWTANRVNT